MNDVIYDWDVVRRFLCLISDATGCLLWTGRRKADGVYGVFDVPRLTNPSRRGAIAAHRVAWEIVHGGRVPEDQTLDHRCNVPLCVNPDHLTVAPIGQNRPRSRAQLRKALWVPPQFAHVVPQNCGLSTVQPRLWNGDAP